MPKTPQVQKEVSQEDQEVESGLVSLSSPIQEQVPEAKPVQDEPVQSPALTAAEQAETRRLVELEAAKRQFTGRVMEARKSEAHVIKPSPVPERIRKQTELEMEAGRKANEAHMAQRAQKPKIIVPKNEGNMTSVFRPADYVPDQKKGQGNVEGRTL